MPVSVVHAPWYGKAPAWYWTHARQALANGLGAPSYYQRGRGRERHQDVKQRMERTVVWLSKGRLPSDMRQQRDCMSHVAGAWRCAVSASGCRNDSPS
jgi:hypothetical protein